MNADVQQDKQREDKPDRVAGGISPGGKVADEAPHKEITEKIIGAAFAVSNALGCGFLEKVYENALCLELARAGLATARQSPLQVQYRGQIVGDFAADLIIEQTVLVELKATLDHNELFEAQTINYLKASGLEVGLLINFGRPKVSIRRFVKGKQRISDVGDCTVDAWRQS